MSRGSQLKNEVSKKILETFPNSFLCNDGKEIRIVGKENEEEIQLKCVLTCAKVNIKENEENLIPGEETEDKISNITTVNKNDINLTQEEKDNIKKLMETFGL